MRENLKSEKGAITLIVLVGMLFLTTFLISMYIATANKAQDSAETTKQIQEEYNNIEEANAIYDTYFADKEIIPIYTKEQLEKIGTGEQITIDGKIYTFTPNGYYTLKNDLDLGGYYNISTNAWEVADGKEWTPLPSTFTGILDGLGHTITGLYINDSTASNQGLFGTLKGTVKNLNILGSYINAKENIDGIAGVNQGKIENCNDDGVILSISTNNGKVQVGGIWYESVENYMNGQPILIDFTIDNEIYCSPEGMAWKSWCSEEEYNKVGAQYLDEKDMIINDLNLLLSDDGTLVKGADFIIEGENYTWITEEQ